MEGGSSAYSRFERNESSAFNYLHLNLSFLRFARCGAIGVVVCIWMLPLISSIILGDCRVASHKINNSTRLKPELKLHDPLHDTTSLPAPHTAPICTNTYIRTLYMRACVRSHTHTYTYTRRQAHKHKHHAQTPRALTHAHAPTHTHIHTYPRAHTHAGTHACACVHIRTHTRTHTCANTPNKQLTHAHDHPYL